MTIIESAAYAPRLVSIGKTVSGKSAQLDARAAEAWLAAVPLIKARVGVDLSLRIIQALGTASASAGTHDRPGVAVDIRTRGWTMPTIDKVVALLRECGFAATWYRDWTDNWHIHTAADIGVYTPARYQIVAVKAGYDGLGSGGKGGKDPHSKPSAWRDATQGAAWARAELAPKPPAPKVPPFPLGIGPGKSRPSARTLQQQLKKAGFMPSSVPEADNYGPRTQDAVAAFHNAHPSLRTKGVRRDVKIGPKGWAKLFSL